MTGVSQSQAQTAGFLYVYQDKHVTDWSTAVDHLPVEKKQLFWVISTSGPNEKGWGIKHN